MKIEFQFNTIDRLILVPENGKDKQLLQLCFGEASAIHLAASPGASPESVVIEISHMKKSALDDKGAT